MAMRGTVMMYIESDDFLVKKHGHLAVVATMSRSLYSFDPNDQAGNLFSVKMGTDTIHGAKNKSKLGDLEENLQNQKKIGSETTIETRVKGVGATFLPDTYEIEVSRTCSGCFGSKTSSYHISVRDYKDLIQDQNRIYMPSFHFYKDLELINRNDPSKWHLPFNWDGGSFYLDRRDLFTFVSQINRQLGKITAIYHMNGKFPQYLHGQNALVGLPLKSDEKIPAILAIRDVGDYAQADLKSPFRISNQRNNPGDPGFYPIYMHGESAELGRRHQGQKTLFSNYLVYLKENNFMDMKPQIEGILSRINSPSGTIMHKCDYDYWGEIIKPFWTGIRENEKSYWNAVREVGRRVPRSN